MTDVGRGITNVPVVVNAPEEEKVERPECVGMTIRLDSRDNVESEPDTSDVGMDVPVVLSVDDEETTEVGPDDGES